MPIDRLNGVWRAALALLPFAYLQGLWFLNGQTFSLFQMIFAYGMGLILLCAFWALRPAPNCLQRRASLQVAAITLLSGLWAAFSPLEIIAWGLALVGLCALVFGLVNAFTRAGWVRFLAAVICSFGLALFIAGCAQLVEGFSEEEFFAGVQVIFLAGWLLLTWSVGQLLVTPSKEDRMLVLPAWLPALLLVVALGLGVLLFRQYQHSFYPNSVPQFAGITSEHPFLCGVLEETGSSTYTGADVYGRIVQNLVENDRKTTPELGMLALLTGDERWQQDFRVELMREVRAGKYTGPAHSVKYGQYDAAQRLYYYASIQEQSQLFSVEEQAEVRNWLEAVNRRALTVEWVDWMYATAFSEWPRGPYLNQEIGVGLLALLKATGSGDPALDGQNQSYLAAHRLGWEKGFRNTDDAFWYQSVWLNNALYQVMANPAQLDQPVIQQRRVLAFDWLLAQARPDGSRVGYNPRDYSLANVAYLGAEMLGDNRLVWLAGVSMDYLDQVSGHVWAQPGITGSLAIDGRAPTLGNCLLYGDSGLPNQAGPLAPDKIVFRGGWQPSDSYLMLNLRFTGWHRYKASNSIVSIYREEPWIVENTSGSAIGWLPVGRAAFRDKRIPRENLNGLVIEKRGISQVLYWLTGFGSHWAQDLPAYAHVERFIAEGAVAESVTTLNDWNGWTHRRKIAFVQDGPIVVFDQADGPVNGEPGITWQVKIPEGSPAQLQVKTGTRIAIGNRSTGEMLMLFENGDAQLEKVNGEDKTSGTLLYRPAVQGEVRLVSVFLPKNWAGAEVQFLRTGNLAVTIRLNGQEIILSAE